MTSNQLFTLVRAVLGMQVQMLNALSLLLVDAGHADIGETMVETAEVAQRLCWEADAILRPESDDMPEAKH